MNTPRIEKILIANRGEIALRVMRTCRKMGISTVAVFSDADVRSPHVRFADEAVRIGPAPSTESYLNISAIIEAARRTRASAIHPGYGFLSENADFAEACRAAGILFIGPGEEVIRKMGLKTTSRRLLAESGVPLVPGYDGEDQSVSTLHKQAREIGLPVLIKASAGGGGKGMRIVAAAAQLDSSIESAKREAAKAFGNDTLLLEKYIERARHIEVQILGDSQGNLLHLFERECSIQRRHQKVIEESPFPGLSPGLRERICEAALSVGRAIGYTSAGTVEFILTPPGEFFFIEVNTRLQVEHPITEMTTGLDLVELQIMIAEGHPIPFSQREIHQTGHAVEARLYAEDPLNDFRPATGTCHTCQFPPAIEGIRIDSGIESSAEVGVYYDPMLAKLIAHGPDRNQALRKLEHALRGTTIHGLRTNRDFLVRMLEHQDFRSGEIHTEFVSEHLEDLIRRISPDEVKLGAAAAALFLHQTRERDAQVLPNIPLDFRNNPYRDPSIRLSVDCEAMEVIWKRLADRRFLISIGDWQVEAEPVEFAPSGIRVSFDGVQRFFRVTQIDDRLFMDLPSGACEVVRLSRYPIHSALAEQADASAPMPGVVSKILVAVGQEIHAGEPLIILEAMKMEQTLIAATDGIVEAILVKQGDVVAPGDVLVHIGATNSTDEGE